MLVEFKIYSHLIISLVLGELLKAKKKKKKKKQKQKNPKNTTLQMIQIVKLEKQARGIASFLLLLHVLPCIPHFTES